MAIVHQMKDQKSGSARTKCGQELRVPAHQHEITVWDSRVTCPDCRTA